jgi:hypothetical protein
MLFELIVMTLLGAACRVKMLIGKNKLLNRFVKKQQAKVKAYFQHELDIGNNLPKNRSYRLGLA